MCFFIAYHTRHLDGNHPYDRGRLDLLVLHRIQAEVEAPRSWTRLAELQRVSEKLKEQAGTYAACHMLLVVRRNHWLLAVHHKMMLPVEAHNLERNCQVLPMFNDKFLVLNVQTYVAALSRSQWMVLMAVHDHLDDLPKLFLVMIRDGRYYDGLTCCDALLSLPWSTSGSWRSGDSSPVAFAKLTHQRLIFLVLSVA